jgi:hypothetical protein
MRYSRALTTWLNILPRHLKSDFRLILNNIKIMETSEEYKKNKNITEPLTTDPFHDRFFSQQPENRPRKTLIRIFNDVPQD